MRGEQIVIGLAGLFAIAAGIFDWDWFMGHRKARWIVALLGRGGARIFYLLFGLALIGFAGTFFSDGVSEERGEESEAGSTEASLLDFEKDDSDLDNLFDRVSELEDEARNESAMLMGADEASGEGSREDSRADSGTPPTEGSAEGGSRTSEAASVAELRLSFAPGSKYRASWAWGSAGGVLDFSVIEVHGDQFKARIALASNPSMSRVIEGRLNPQASQYVVKLSANSGSGISRQTKQNAFARDPSLRWLFQDSAYDIFLRKQGDLFSGISNGDVAWQLQSIKRPS